MAYSTVLLMVQSFIELQLCRCVHAGPFDVEATAVKYSRNRFTGAHELANRDPSMYLTSVKPEHK